MSQMTAFQVTVDYRIPLPELIAAGRYNWIDREITVDRFTPTGKGSLVFEVKLFHLNSKTLSERAANAINEFQDCHPWQPGSIEHLLSFGAKYPQEQLKYPIIALGPKVETFGRTVPRIDARGRWRRLDLSWWDRAWNEVCRFVAIRPAPA